MELKDTITVLISVFGAGITMGGLVVAIYKYRREGKHDNIDYAEKVEKFYEKRDKSLAERIKCLEEKIEALLKAEKDHKKNLEQWIEYSKKLEHTIADLHKKIVSLDNTNIKLSSHNQELKKCCEGS